MSSSFLDFKLDGIQHRSPSNKRRSAWCNLSGIYMCFDTYHNGHIWTIILADNVFPFYAIFTCTIFWVGCWPQNWDVYCVLFRFFALCFGHLLSHSNHDRNQKIETIGVVFHFGNDLAHRIYLAKFLTFRTVQRNHPGELRYYSVSLNM